VNTLAPIHLGIIPDGNRRWAASHELHPWKGHEQAIENFRSLTEWCRDDPRIGILTVWCFSTENWRRDPKEIEMLMTMLEDYLKKEKEEFVKNKTRLLHSGRKDRIPPSLAEVIKEVEEMTLNHFPTFVGSGSGQAKDQAECVLNLAVDYGGKDEILRSIDKYQKTKNEKPKTNQLPDLRLYLDHPELPDIDLIIRTSGEKRTSNFFLWQAAYAEWDFVDKLFPDFNTDDLAASVDNFFARNRRFGE